LLVALMLGLLLWQLQQEASNQASGAIIWTTPSSSATTWA
jgi:ABC-type polysaccharide/polyol phosphate export permease